MTKVDLIGRQFGYWTVVSPLPRKGRVTMWLCRCDCGREVHVRAGNLTSGGSTNCGCKRQHFLVHGHSRRGGRTPTYRIWKGMHSRCKPECVQSQDYYERGITVCDEWSSYERFLQDMGERPTRKHSIDRIDNDRGYAPGNCRWATASVQRVNSRRIAWISYNGAIMPLKDASALIGVSDGAIHQQRKRHGGSHQEAFEAVLARRHQ